MATPNPARIAAFACSVHAPQAVRFAHGCQSVP